MRICTYGTYDLQQPRTRVILEGLRRAGADVVLCHADLWKDTSQKVHLARHPAALLRQLAVARGVYQTLARQRRSLGACDVVVYPHMGQFDLLVSAPWFRRHGIPVVWDALISLHDTVVSDRRLVNARSIWAWLLKQLDTWVGRLADCVIVDTQQNLDYWRASAGIPVSKLHVVPVGAEDMFVGAREPLPSRTADQPMRVLFYGQYIPLHGVDTIVRAAHELRTAQHITWTMVGTGQERQLAESLAAELEVTNVRFVDWVPYQHVPRTVAQCDVGLGIFGLTGKAQRVVPNKAYQILAAGRPLVTADTPASRDLLCRDGLEGAWLVEPGDPAALAASILDLAREPHRASALANAGAELFDRHYTSSEVGRQAARVFARLTATDLARQ